LWVDKDVKKSWDAREALYQIVLNGILEMKGVIKADSDFFMKTGKIEYV